MYLSVQALAQVLDDSVYVTMSRWILITGWMVCWLPETLKNRKLYCSYHDDGYVDL